MQKINALRVYQKEELSNIPDIARYVMFTQEKLKSIKAEISLIQRAGLAEAVYRQKHKEAQDLADMVADAETRMGELMAEMPKAQGKRTDLTSFPRGNEVAETKERQLSDLGFTKRQASQFQAMAKNPDIVEQAKAEARENEDIVSRSFILEKIKTAEREQREQKRETERVENADKVAKLENPLDAMGLFQTIVIDPPWDWGDEGDVNQMGRAKPDYATMPIEDVGKLPIAKIADNNCHLYLWVTNRSLPKAFRLIDEWGFRYITCITWVKPSFGMGNYFRGSTEQVLFAVKGSQPLKRKDVGTHFSAPRGKRHSEKPDEFYEIVKSCSHRPFIDIFGRGERDGWTVWGESTVGA